MPAVVSKLAGTVVYNPMSAPYVVAQPAGLSGELSSRLRSARKGAQDQTDAQDHREDHAPA